MLILEINGNPIPQQRPRFKQTQKFAIAFDPQKKEKEQYRWQVRSQFRNHPLTTPLRLDVTFFMPIPKSTSQIKKREMIANVIHHIKKPDIDNLAKFVLDCLIGLVYEDDAQIWSLNVEKMYAEKPGTLIVIDPYNHQKEEKDASSER